MNDDFKNYIQLLIDNKDKITHLPERDIHNLLDYITNLQAELQDTNDTLQDKLDYIGHLEELCNKYEEEHNTTFKKWQDDKKFVENRTKEWLDYKSRIEKATEITKDLKQFVYDELVDRNVCGATEIHSKIIDLLDILMVGVMNK